ncbi:MAG: serine/threonine protein kinase [Eubacterium sp.]|nr:serine/threonine protein kinase [Eubacterium sp.]
MDIDIVILGAAGKTCRAVLAAQTTKSESIILNDQESNKGGNSNMEYEEIRLVKQSEKSTIHLIRDEEDTQLLIRKVLTGRHPVYEKLQEYSHPCLPRVHEVLLSDDMTTVVEEYIEGESLDSGKLTEKQCKDIVRELCGVLEFLHGKGIIHRDIKPSNILLAQDGHIRLIDFDAARMIKEEQIQDTILLGTRGYAPPEQYGFAQTDERADIYALGVTLKNILGEKSSKAHYQKVISKCTNLDPDKRYRTVRQVERAFFFPHWTMLCVVAVVVLGILVWSVMPERTTSGESVQSDGLIVLSAPEEPHWDQETGIAYWRNVPEAGEGDIVKYDWKLYRCDTPTPPDLDTTECDLERSMRGRASEEFFDLALSCEFWDNGFYYFAVRASGDGVTYADSSYVLSDAFEYTGADAPRLPAPENLSWILKQDEESNRYFAAFDNWDDYEDKDTIQVFVYDENGEWVNSDIYYKEELLANGWPGILVPGEYVNQQGKSYRFAIQVTSSRPNEYRASPEVFPWPVEEEYLSPWLRNLR